MIEPRQCVFVGTTNQSTYLDDPTGGRRFWPIKVGRIDIDGLADDREQLFAEAVHLYRLGELWWPNHAFEKQHIRPEQEARFQEDIWQVAISTYLSNEQKVTVGQVAVSALKFEQKRIGTADTRRITGIMERLGWKRREKIDSKGNRWWDCP